MCDPWLSQRQHQVEERNTCFGCVSYGTGLSGESLRNVAPLWKYVAVSVSNVYASACQYEALKYVSFPVQILGKSFKMMPVMVWGMAVGGKHYTCIDWAIAVAISGGVFEFLMTGPISPDHAAGDDSHKTRFISFCQSGWCLCLWVRVSVGPRVRESVCVCVCLCLSAELDLWSLEAYKQKASRHSHGTSTLCPVSKPLAARCENHCRQRRHHRKC